MARRNHYKPYRPHVPQKNFRFHVVGRGCFPLDMLRYDHCRPATDADKALIDNGEYNHERRTVMLETDQRTVCAARWESFGWRVLGVADHVPSMGLQFVDTRDLPQVSA